MNSYKGVNGQIEIEGPFLIIKRKGLLGVMTQGFKGDKKIPIANITSVQFKQAGVMLNGYIQFSIPGGVEARGGVFNASKDENTVMFNKLQSEAFTGLRDLIEQQMTTPKQSTQPTVSIADELAKLADLKEKGFLTEDEFAQQKASLLSR